MIDSQFCCIVQLRRQSNSKQCNNDEIKELEKKSKV